MIVKKDVVTVYNLIGEDTDGRAEYTSVMLERVYLDYLKASSGKENADSVTLYVFDKQVIAGKPFIQCLEWDALSAAEKRLAWTLKIGDKIAVGDSTAYQIPESVEEDEEPTHSMQGLEAAYEAFTVSSVKTFQQGPKRMWHMEVGGG